MHQGHWGKTCGVRAFFDHQGNLFHIQQTLPMKLLPWNIRGCSAPSKKILLKKKIREEKPLVIFIQETKCSEESFKSIASKIWKNCEASAIDASGTAGGIGIIWNPSGLSLTNFMATKFSIFVEFHILGTNSKGFLTNVYGPFKLASKQLFLRSLQNMSNLVGWRHWIIGPKDTG